MRKYNIVIVENDEDEQFFMKEGFDAVGLFHIMAQLKNGDVLMDWLSGHPHQLPDLVLSDLNMPGKSGYDIIEGVKSNPRYTHIPVIITSTSSTPTMVDKCLSLGAAGYMVKPETFVAYEPFVKDLHRLVEEKQLVK